MLVLAVTSLVWACDAASTSPPDDAEDISSDGTSPSDTSGEPAPTDAATRPSDTLVDVATTADVEAGDGDATDVEETVEPECEAGTYCLEGVAGICTTAGLWQPGQDCGAEGLLCVGGTCRSPCEVEGDEESVAGCDHWAVGLAHGAEGPFAITALNVSSVPAGVAVWRVVDDTAVPTVVASTTLKPGAVHAFALPPGETSETGRHWQGLRLRATAPVIAYQHSPLAGNSASSGDGALLLPVHGLGTEYVAVGRPQSRAADGTPTRATLTVVASEAGTQLTLVPSVPLRAGASLGTLSADDEFQLPLQAHEVLHLTTSAERDDLSGTRIFASRPVAIFAGHEADTGAGPATIGTPGDHLEDILRPVSRWGRTHVAPKTSGHGGSADALLIIAAVDDTLVQFDPPLHSDALMSAGELLTRTISEAVVVSSSNPVQIVQLTAGAGEKAEPSVGSPCTVDWQCGTDYVCVGSTCALPTCVGALDTVCPSNHHCTCEETECQCEPIGDTAWWVLPPVAQFEAVTRFSAPATYTTHSVELLLPPDTDLPTLDGVAVETWVSPLGTTGWHSTTIKVSSGPHVVSGPGPIGVIVHGGGQRAGYGHAAGQTLRDLQGALCDVDADCPVSDNLCFGVAACDTTRTPARCGFAPGSAVICEEVDGPCVQSICEPSTGGCLAVVADDGTSCASGAVPCAVGVCDDGVCVDPVVDCDDGVFCNGAEVCDEDTNTCQPGTLSDLDDSIECTEDLCDEGLGIVYHAPRPELCDDGFVCNGFEICDPLSGCVHQVASICDDGVFCNGIETCNDVTCLPGSPPEVDDGLPCTIDACDEGIGAVAHLPEHGECDDGLPCTTDTCDLEVGCVQTALSCDDGDMCTTDLCEAETGCAYFPVNCDDEDACTVDICDVALGCVYAALGCDDGDVCTPDFCIPASGCVHGATCDDDDACTIDGCEAEGECTTQDVDCNDDDTCTTDLCDPSTGCHHINLCDDGNACTTDSCAGQVCAYEAVNCDDEDPCTTDSCTPLTGCSNIPLDCDDGIPCTLDGCDATGSCTNPDVECDDGSLCTVDVCDESGGCIYAAMDCDDDIPCTTDVCHGDSGCENISSCDDGYVCTVDTCLDGGGCDWLPLDCDDQDPCTQDSCDSLSGCLHINTCGGG